MASRSKKESAAGGDAPLQRQLDQRTRELAEATEQQAAIRDVLSVMSNSPGDVKPVFEAVARHAARICETETVDIFVAESGSLRRDASVGALGRMQTGETLPINCDTVVGRSVVDKQPYQVADLLSADHDFPLAREYARRLSYRTSMAVPLLREGRALGTISLRRAEVRPFEDRHIALLKTFADQAAIAIENARLVNDLSEALEQQTATSEVLKAISSSPGDLKPVFSSMLENAIRLCEAKFGNLFLIEGEACRWAAGAATPPKLAEYYTHSATYRPTPGSHLDRVMRTKQVTHSADDAAEAVVGAAARMGGARSSVCVPMLKDDTLVGAIFIYRTEVRPFTDKQIELVQNFAAQAAIAIENTRLLNELRQRTDDLSESLEQQTATSEVLKVISSSRGDIAPVFNALLDNATRICDAKFGTLFRYDGEFFHVDAHLGVPPALEAAFKTGPRRPTPLSGLARIVADRRTVHIPDVRTERAYLEGDPLRREIADLGGARTFLAIPMLRDAELVGAFAIYRQEVRPFTDKQIELVENFAAQAVIAIENTRLLNEVRTLNQQLEGRVAEQVGEIERMGRLRRFLSPQVADLIVSSGNEKQLESHRREITALFCDLRGFTGFSESSDPEDVMALLREYHKAIGEIIFRHGGTLERFAGDGVMVIFGDPVPLPNPALSAVQMSLEMRGAIGMLIEKWRRLGHELGFGIGIAHGYATLGTIGFEGRFDYAAIGTVSNVASRLCDEAQPGQILVSPRVLLAVENAVAVEPVAEMTLKGIRRPIQVHNVVNHRTANNDSE